MCGKLAAKRIWRQVVDEGPLPLDLDNRQPFAVARLELGVAGDVDLLELEVKLGAQDGKLVPGAVAEMAPRGAVEPHPWRYG